MEAKFEQNFPTLSAQQIVQAAFDAFNAGYTRIANNIKNGLPLDTGTTGGNYGSNVLGS